jgi:hypothetical protein
MKINGALHRTMMLRMLRQFKKQKEVVTDGKTDEEEKNLRIASNKSIWTAACA